MNAACIDRRRRQVLCAALATAGCVGGWLPHARSSQDGAALHRPVRVALLGDTPYSAGEEGRLLRLMSQLAGKVEWALHVGDLKGSRESCHDSLLERRVALLDRCPIPLIYTPGDNDWVDCWRDPATDFDPVERLSWLRRRVFDRSTPLLGASPVHTPALAAVEQQSKVDGGLPENLRWVAGGAVWITLNLPGSDNGIKASIADEHRRERDAANRRWMSAARSRAQALGLRTLVIAAHANPGFEKASGEDGYADFRTDLVRTQRELDGPVLLMHGDTHRFRHDWITPGLLRIECFGSPFSQSWVSVQVDGASTRPFLVSTEHL